MEDLALYLAASATDSPTNIHLIKWLDTLQHEFPALTGVKLSQFFPDEITDLTFNFFSRLAYELEVVRGDPISHGVVGTPAILAMDMASLAATLWLIGQIEMSEEDLCTVIFGLRAATMVEQETISRILSKATWYDPCIGGGVFPVAILLLLARLGVVPNREQLSKIRGGDRDPVTVTASYIRMALAVSSITGKPYADARKMLPRMFRVGNSLERYSEQGRQWPKLFSEQNGVPVDYEDEMPVDIVVTNPPYVRADRLSDRDKLYLKKNYPSVAGGSVDLYNYFIAHGLLALREKGILCYVSPASFQKSKYGLNTRKYIRSQGNTRVLFDFNELPIFNGASVHASVYAIVKSQPQSAARAYVFDSLPQHKPLLYGLERSVAIPATNIGISGWHTSRSEFEATLKILYKDSVPLIDYAGHILSGIKTGYRKAFLLSRIEAELIQRDERSAEFIKPLLLPVNIRTWRSDWKGTHLIFIRKGELVPAESSLMQHLSVHEKALRQRSDIQGHPTWYGLRECTYEHLFTQPKIIFPDIASSCRFALDTQGFYISDGAFMIPRVDYFLLGVLNSCIGRFYFRIFCNSIGNPQDGGRLRFKKTYVEEFPLPRPVLATALLREEIEQLARSLTTDRPATGAEERIDELSLELYNIPEQYQQLVREGC